MGGFVGLGAVASKNWLSLRTECNAVKQSRGPALRITGLLQAKSQLFIGILPSQGQVLHERTYTLAATFGPAANTSGNTLPAYFSKLSANFLARVMAAAS